MRDKVGRDAGLFCGQAADKGWTDAENCGVFRAHPLALFRLAVTAARSITVKSPITG